MRRTATLAPLIAAVAACGTLLEGPDLPTLSDGGVSSGQGAVVGRDAGSEAGSSTGAGSSAGAGAGAGSSAGSGSGTGSRSGSGAGAESGSLSSTSSDSGTGSGSGSTTSEGFDAGIGSGGPPPSCVPGGPGLTNCGVSSESCCVSPEVVGGAYSRTYTSSGSGPTGEADPASVSTFRLDKYLVTVGRFRQFVAAASPVDGGTGWLPPPGSGKHGHLNAGKGLVADGEDGGLTYEPGWASSDDGEVAPTNANLECDASYATWTRSPASNETRPINCTTWQEAYAFCIWDGGFLPSESEWEYAAAGGDQELAYPWGASAPGTESSYAIYGCTYPAGSPGCSGVSNIAPVGTATHGAGRWGQLDLAGDAWEWNLDWYKGSYVSPCTDCAYLGVTADRALRGGNFGIGAAYLPPSYRLGAAPTARTGYLGFRCARTP
jgi:sulfatase modifying factor 1